MSDRYQFPSPTLAAVASFHRPLVKATDSLTHHQMFPQKSLPSLRPTLRFRIEKAEWEEDVRNLGSALAGIGVGVRSAPRRDLLDISGTLAEAAGAVVDAHHCSHGMDRSPFLLSCSSHLTEILII
ncbi:hypothetical protein AKJ16_DCAP18228 [Drosera capensis]